MKNINTLSGLSVANFSKQIDGKETALYTLCNKVGAELAITNYGAKIVSLMVPDKNGKMTDVVTGHNSIEEYLTSEEPYFGAICGRYGNRIAAGKFTIDGITYDKLAINNGPNSLHGGIKGFNAVVWDAKQIDEQTIELKYTSADGEEGFPGELKTTVTYHLTNENEVVISYQASTDKPTVLNLTNHSYFNLSGAGDPYIGDHILTINADYYLPTDNTAIPYGPKEKVEGTPMDFTEPHLIGERIDADFDQLKMAGGYDHNWVLDNYTGQVRKIAVVKSSDKSRIMEVYTDLPGVQFYSGNSRDLEVAKDGKTYGYRAGLALETQFYPDTPNKPQFPSSVFGPDRPYHTVTEYRFV